MVRLDDRRVNRFLWTRILFKDIRYGTVIISCNQFCRTNSGLYHATNGSKCFRGSHVPFGLGRNHTTLLSVILFKKLMVFITDYSDFNFCRKIFNFFFINVNCFYISSCYCKKLLMISF